MSLSFVILILVSLVGAPLLTLEIFSHAKQWQKTQVTLDNSAILLGRRDQALFQSLSLSQRQLRILHETHHPLHVCAKAPKTALVCGPKDKWMESQIQSVAQKAFLIAQTGWKKNGEITEREIAHLKSPQLQRASQIPLRRFDCPVCFFPLSWDVSNERDLRSILSADGPPVIHSVVRLHRGNTESSSKWRYQLELSP